MSDSKIWVKITQLRIENKLGLKVSDSKKEKCHRGEGVSEKCQKVSRII